MRIDVHIPDELIQRVKQANPDANISQICRDALENYAYKSEQARDFCFANYEEMQELAKELSESDEHPLVEPDWTAYGLIDARDWVRTATAEDWDAFFDFYDIIAKRNGEEKAIDSADHARRADGVKGFHDRWAEHREDFNRLMDQDIYVPRLEYRKTYNTAWVSYVLESRRVYLEYRQSERDRVMAERKRAWQSLAEPELPPNLI